METGLEPPWLPHVVATDASLTDYRVVGSPATLREIKNEACFTETKDWTIGMNDVHDNIEDSMLA
eukprot:10601027-Heterocapsa_arctica.AAC.1